MSLVISTSPGPLFWCARGCPCMCLPLGSTSLACRMWSSAVIHPVAPVEFDYFLNYMHTDTHDFHEGFWILSLVPSFLGCQGDEIHDPCLLSELKSMRRLVCGSEEVRHKERLFSNASSQKYVLAKRSRHYNVGGTMRHIYLSLMLSTDNEDICAYTILARTHSKAVGGAITSRIT